MVTNSRLVSSESGVVVLDAQHHFSRIDIPSFHGTIRAELGLGRDIILNLTEVPYIDNLACAAIIAAKQIARDHGHEMRLCGVLQERVGAFFAGTSIFSVVPYYTHEADAIASIAAAAAAGAR